MEKPSYKYCLNTSTIRCGDPGLPEMIDITARAGYDGIEPWIRELDLYVEQGDSIRDLSSRLQDLNLSVYNLIGFFEWAVDEESSRSKALEEARHAFTLAAALDCPYVAAPPSGIYNISGVSRAAIAERYAVLIDIGIEYGVVPLVEFWGIAQSLGSLGDVLYVTAECGRPQAKILADVYHTYKSCGHFHGFQHIAKNSLGLLHVNDYPLVPGRQTISDADRVFPGEGIAPWTDIVNHLEAINYCGVLSLELFNKTYWSQPAKNVAETGLRKMRDIFG